MRSTEHKLFTIIVLISMTFLSGCGYRFRADGKPVGVEFDSLAIPLMKSTSSFIGFEADFTGIIREEFISHSAIPLVSEEEASAVLTGRVYQIMTRPLTYNSISQTVEDRNITYESTSSRRLTIRLDINLADRMTGKQIWHETDMEEEARFEVVADPLITRYNQQQALLKIARLLAKRIYLKTVERF